MHIADYAIANHLAAHCDRAALHHQLDTFAERYCLVVNTLSLTYHWSLWQVEYATDLVFKQRRPAWIIQSPQGDVVIAERGISRPFAWRADTSVIRSLP